MLGSPTPTETMNITAIEEELIREYYGLPPQRPCPLKIQKKWLFFNSGVFSNI